MKHTISRRNLLTTTAAVSCAIGFGALPAFASCGRDHKKMGYRLGAALVDPTTTSAAKVQVLANAKCPDCGAKIEPSGLSYGEHMQG